MKEIDREDNFEVVTLWHDTTRSSSEEINQQQTERVSNQLTNFQKLPGQVFSEEEDEDEDQDSSSIDEFDIETFRKLKSQSANDSKKASQWIQPSGSAKKSPAYLKILGIEFDIGVLQERNKDAILFLKSALVCKVSFDFVNFVTFMVGLDFRILPMILSIGLAIVTAIIDVYIIKQSIKNGIKITPVFLLIAFSTGVLYCSLFFYSLLVRLPFNSLPLFMLLEYIIIFQTVFAAAMFFIPNFLSNDDPNYQLKFFASRIMAGFFNATGYMDALTDIVLGIKLVQYPQKKFLIIGIFLLILCNIDFLQVLRKITTPTKFSFKDQIFAVLVEVAVLVLTTVVLVDLSKISAADQNENTLFATVISIATTVINFMHNLFLLYSKSRTDSTEFF